MHSLLPRRLLATILAAGAILALPAVAGAAAVRSPAVTAGSRYLALGDSVTFGYLESTVLPTPNYQKQAYFLGYPEHLARELKLRVTNASCPGETSGSFINVKAISNSCENTRGSAGGYRVSFPLHVKYKGSQLAFAVSFLRAHRDVRLVSLMIGANDLFVCQATTSDACQSLNEQHKVALQIQRNVHHIVSEIRNVAHYRGQLLIVNYYSLDYTSALFSSASQILNDAQDTGAAPFHVEIADGYGEFKSQVRDFGMKTCAAGLLTQWATSNGGVTCGVHPSYAGQALLAEAVIKAIRL